VVTAEDTPAPVAQAARADSPATAEPPAADPAETRTTASTTSGNRLAEAGAAQNALTARGVRELDWEELMPEGEDERLAQLYRRQMEMLYAAPISEGSAADQAVQIGTFNTVPELNGARIRLPGYTVPFEYGANVEITEFLLVPYYGACLHAPPPPPNQTVFVTTETPIRLRDLAQAVWVEGTLYAQIQESDLADAAYTIKMDVIETYEY
jgi:hypothetical protein